MAPSKAPSKKKKYSFVFTAVAATCCGVFIAVALHSVAPNRDAEVEQADVQMQHEIAVSRHRAKVQQRSSSEPLPDPARPYRTIKDKDTDGVYGDDSPYSKPAPSAVYANLVKQAKPYRKEMIQRLRDQVDHPEEDDADQRLNHEAIDYIEKKGIYFQ